MQNFMCLQCWVTAKWVFHNLNSLSLRALGVNGLVLLSIHLPQWALGATILSTPLHFPIYFPLNQSITGNAVWKFWSQLTSLLGRHFMCSSFKKREGSSHRFILVVLPAPSHHSIPETPSPLVQFRAVRIWATSARFMEKQLASPYC